MLVNSDNSIPRISATVFERHNISSIRHRIVAPDLANISEESLNNLRKAEASYNGEPGTFVKLFGFDFHPTPRGDDSLRAMASQSMTQAGWSCLNAYLFDLPFPIAITDSRDVQKDDLYRFEDGVGRLLSRHTEKFPVSRIIYGNVRRLDAQRKQSTIKDVYEVERKIFCGGSEQGSITIRFWFFKGDLSSESVKVESYTETNKSHTRIFFTLNGQTILRQGRNWSGFEDLDLYYVPEHVIIQVELDNLSDSFKTDLFDSARKIFDSRTALILFNDLKDALNSFPNLQNYENYYEDIYNKRLSLERNTKLEKQLRRLITDPGLQMLNPRAKLRAMKWKTHRKTAYEWIERDPPTWIEPYPAGEVEIEIGENRKIQLRHNGPTRLFSRKTRAGKIELKWEADKGFVSSVDGSVITISIPQEIAPNEENILNIAPMVGRKSYPNHRVLIRAIPNAFESSNPPTKFEIVKTYEPMKINPGATFKISIRMDASNDIFKEPNSKWKVLWEISPNELLTMNQIREKSRESPRNGRMGFYFEVSENIPIDTVFVLTIQLLNEENQNLNLPRDSIRCKIIRSDRTPSSEKWYERRKKYLPAKA